MRYTSYTYIRLLLLASISWLAACTSHPDIPQGATASNQLPAIYPDYCNVTVPCNIAPLNFMLPDSLYTECVACFTAADGTQLTFGSGNKIIVPISDWEALKMLSLDKTMKVEVYGKHDEQWTAFKAFEIHIAKDSIDPYISYRLIQPSYGYYDEMNISQRRMDNWDESEIMNNKVACNDRRGQCINCHSYQNYSTQNMLFHVRVTNGGTVLVTNGEVKKVDLKREGMISAGVYPAWHPTEQLVAFSTNDTHQWFHTADRNKVEVFDKQSDLILYDIQQDKVTTICNDSNRLEVFPTWTPDGKQLYYCSADRWAPDSTNRGDFRLDYQTVRYNLYRRMFDQATRQFGPEELVYQADTLGRSVSLPRVSPDGRYLTFAEGDYGCFNIWHKEADIRVLDLQTMQMVPTQNMNSPKYAESYPSFSSNGRWIMCASRRDDGNYSRVYLSYFDGTQAHKAFLLPQADPEQNVFRLKSYNRPEFMKESVTITMQEFEKVIKQ